MVTRKQMIIIAAIGVAVASSVWLLYPEGPKAQIRQRCRDLAEIVSKSGAESNRDSVFKAYGLRSYFAEECELVLSEFEHKRTYAPEETAATAARLRVQATTFNVRLEDMAVTLESAQRAQVRLTAWVELRRAGEVRPRREAKELICSLEKLEGKWRFARFEEVAVLER